ncbi:MAG TPA: PIG-L family deacetylase [Oligoflexia bacterium]|nr:PIG-L family deacetylase [Oligoflexia bacterium]HMR24237.1 PIG-L family deacetylase [Oligoflexia bacterium]
MYFSKENFLKRLPFLNNQRKLKLIIVLLFVQFVSNCAHQVESIKSDVQHKEKVFLVLAHPDDETMLGGFLLELKRLNIPVYALYLTSGEGGKLQVLDKKGEWQGQNIDSLKLKKIREHELSKAATNYGFQNYFLFNQKDEPLRDKSGLPIRDGQVFLNKKIWNKQQIQKKILTLFEKYKPSYVITMSLDQHTHAHHKASRIILDELKLTQKFSFIKGVYAYTETNWVEPSKEDEKKLPMMTLDRKQKMPQSKYSYGSINAQIASAHYSQRSGHIDLSEHKEEIYQVDGSLLNFYELLCSDNNCGQRIQYIVHKDAK